MKEKIISKIKICLLISVVVLILVFTYLFRGYFPFYNKDFTSLEQIKQKAIEATGGGEVVFVETDFFGIFPHYDVSVRYQNLIYNLEIYAKSGELKSFEIEN